MRIPLRSRPSGRIAPWPAALAAAAATLGLAATAAAAPVTFPEPGGNAAITLDPGDARPGDWVAITGRGFERASGTGHPWVALKVNDLDLPWDSDGPSAIEGSPADAKLWFAASDTGTFSGRLHVPEDFTAPGPGVGEDAGKHGLRVLSGAFSDDTLSNTRPITYQAFFAVTPRATLGVTSPNGTTFEAGTVFRPGGQVTVRGEDFAPEADVDVTLDGTDLPTDARTDVAGTVLGSGGTNRVTLPAGTAPGEHALRIATGAVAEVHRIRVTAPPTATVTTTRVRPGGTLAFAFDGFVGVDGRGQKVGVVIGPSAALACVQADGNGAGRGTLVVPDDVAAGAVTVGFVAGTSCVGPTGPQDDLPSAFVPRPATVAADAPQARATGAAPAGGAVAVDGDGFAAGAAVAVELDGAPVATTLAAGDDGRFAGTVPLPASTPVGPHVLTFRTGATTAVARLTTTAAIPGGEGPTTPANPTTPAEPSVPVPTTPLDPPTLPLPPGPGPGAPPQTPAAPAPPRLGAAKVAGTRLRLTLSGTPGRSVAITVRSARRVRTTARGRARIVTLATGTTTRTGTVSLRLTADGRRALRRTGALRVEVRLTPKGGKAVRRVVTLRATAASRAAGAEA